VQQLVMAIGHREMLLTTGDTASIECSSRSAVSAPIPRSQQEKREQLCKKFARIPAPAPPKRQRIFRTQTVRVAGSRPANHFESRRGSTTAPSCPMIAGSSPFDRHRNWTAGPFGQAHCASLPPWLSRTKLPVSQ
jgi:hypothetical protein